MRQRAARNPGFPWISGGLKGTRYIQEEIELYGFRTKVGGTAAIVPVLSCLSSPVTQATVTQPTAKS